MENKDIFIFAIAYNCGKVLNKMLDSFHELHDHKIHIFGTHKDFKSVMKHKNNEYIEMSIDDALKEYYKQGHLGTAYIWTKVLRHEYGNYNKVIQIDSDVIFRKECLSDILNKFDDGYDLVGPRRSYDNSICKREDIKGIGLPDAVSTYFLGVNLDKISNFDFNTLHRMIVGYYNPLQHPILDFFDPVTFDIINNNGKVFYLDFKDYGSTDENGNFDNGFKKMNELYDFGNKIIHFGGLGSGENFVKNGANNVPNTYVNWAKERYALYMELFYNEKVGVDFDKEIYEITKNSLSDLKTL